MSTVTEQRGDPLIRRIPGIKKFKQREAKLLNSEGCRKTEHDLLCQDDNENAIEVSLPRMHLRQTHPRNESSDDDANTHNNFFNQVPPQKTNWTNPVEVTTAQQNNTHDETDVGVVVVAVVVAIGLGANDVGTP